jgi:hydrogenase maturation protease
MTAAHQPLPVVIIGVGNPMRHDDGLGAVVAAWLERADRIGKGICADVLVVNGEPTRLMEAWRGRRRAIVIDAIHAGEPAGSIHRFEVGVDPLPGPTAGSSSHSAGLAEAVMLGAALDLLPEELIVYGIEPCDMSLGEGLSSEVRSALPDLLQRVSAEIAR